MLTYNEALDTIIENTEIGYTLDSQDRLWIVFIYDLWSEDEMRFNRLYPRDPALGGGWGYDLTIDGVLVFASRKEAEAFAADLREGVAPQPVYVVNLGDDARWERWALGQTPDLTPRFKGSEAGLAAMTEMRDRWRSQHG